MVRTSAVGGGASRLRGFLASASLLLAAAAAAPAQQGGGEAPVDLRRLKFEFKCSFQTKAWEGKGEEAFLDRLRSQRGLYAGAKKEELPQLEDLMADALWMRAEHFKSKDDLESASGFAAELRDLSSRTGRVAELRKPASELVDSYSFTTAQAVEKNDSRKAWTLYLQCVGSTDAAIQSKSVEAVVRIAVADSDLKRVAASGDLAGEGAQLDAVLARLGKSIPAEVLAKPWKGIQDLRDRRTKIADDTCTLVISFIDLKGRLASLQGEKAPLDLATAEFRMVPTGGEGKAWPGERRANAPQDNCLVLAGTYDIEVFAPGSDRPAALWRGAVLGKKQTFQLRVPGLAPEGMIYVGPWQGGGGFFIDITEVTVGQVKAAAARDPGLDVLKSQQEGADDRPAWFRDDDQGGDAAAGTAERFAKSVGKAIPTPKQWMDAAFGPGSAPYPWGTAAPDPSKHMVNGVDGPLPVGSRPAGASPYGCLDMAGNVSEWVEVNRTLWALGGHYQGDLKAGGKDRLRDPIPGFSALSGLPQAEKDKYLQSKPYEDYYATGLRLVVPVE